MSIFKNIKLKRLNKKRDKLFKLSHKYGSKILRLVKNLAVSRSMTWLSIWQSLFGVLGFTDQIIWESCTGVADLDGLQISGGNLADKLQRTSIWFHCLGVTSGPNSGHVIWRECHTSKILTNSIRFWILRKYWWLNI